MRIVIATILALCLSTPALAKKSKRDTKTEINFESLDVRPVQRQSDDLFSAFSGMMNAREALAAKDMVRAHNGYSQLLFSDPDNIEALLGVGESSLALGDLNQAHMAFERVRFLPHESEDEDRRLSGMTLIRVMTDPDIDIEAVLKETLVLVPADPKLWTYLGQHYDRQSLWEKSAHAYRQARLNGQSEAGMTNNFGMSYLAQKRYAAAIELFTLASALDPETDQYDNNRRLALLLDGQYLQALDAIDADRAAPLLNDAGYVAMQRGDYALSKLLLEKALDISPSFYKDAAVNLEILKSL